MQKQKLLTKMITKNQSNELIKCSKDPVYFSKFVDVTSNFKLYPFQKSILNIFTENKKVFSLNSRQTGSTTLCLIYALWYALYNPYKTISISSLNYVAAKNKYSKVKHLYNNVPDFLKCKIKKYNANLIKFENDSCILFKNYSPDSYRGHNVNLMILDDFAFSNNSEEFWNCVFPCTYGNNVIINTSLNSDNKFISQLWNDKFKRIVVPWFLTNGKTETWYNNTKNMMGSQNFKQEYLDFGYESMKYEFSNKILAYWSWFTIMQNLENKEIFEV